MSSENSIHTDQKPAVNHPQEAPNYDSEVENETRSLYDFSFYSQEFDSSRKDRLSSMIDVRCKNGYSNEFWSEDFMSSSAIMSLSAPEDIVFCRRLFNRPYGRNPPLEQRGRIKFRSSLKLKKQRLSFQWKLRLFRKQRNPYHRLKANHPNSMGNYCRRNTCFDKSVKKVGSAQSCDLKRYRWRRLLVFGCPRFPVEMELQDIKMRQNRRRMIFQSLDCNGIEKRNNRSWVLWRLLRTLTCSGGYHERKRRRVRQQQH